jgi:predicted DNA-binding transcriptional regulator AlpA
MGERIGRRFLRTPEESEYRGLSSRTLEKRQTYGTGPTYRKLGGRVVYDLADLLTWAESGLRASISEPAHRT